jgi:hypothetical protein
MGDISTERLAPSSPIVEPKPQPSRRESGRPPRRKPPTGGASDEKPPNTADTDVPPHHVDRLA